MEWIAQELYELWCEAHLAVSLQPPEVAWISLDWTTREVWAEFANVLTERST